MQKPHVLAIPYPAQGHVIPTMELSLSLVKHGIKVTFVNSDFNHNRVLKTFPETDDSQDMINLVSIPDGLEPHEDRNDLGKLTESLLNVMPGKLESLIEEINESDDDKISWVIADVVAGWALKVAEKMGINGAAFWPAAAAQLALVFSFPKLIEDGIIGDDGTVPKDQIIQLSPAMPPMYTAHLVWNQMGDPNAQRAIFELFMYMNDWVKAAKRIISNSALELETASFTLFPEMLSIGPLLAGSRLGKSAGYFWPDDSACLAWLDQQAAKSVIYVAFGSSTIFDEKQFQELALGLEMTNMPFLWVVREAITVDINKAYPEGFRDRTKNRGLMISWAPQQEVLSHPAVACFVSHCGWNSTVEGVSNGVPFLCWPYFADQFFNQTYICDVWKVGLGLARDESGIIARGEIKSKIDGLISDQSFTTSALELKENVKRSVAQGGCSSKNFKKFITVVKEEANKEKVKFCGEQLVRIKAVDVSVEDI